MGRNQVDIGLSDVQELFAMLTGGEVAGDLRLQAQPKLSSESAFSVIYFLQERMRLIEDHYELCQECWTVYDSEESGCSLSEDQYRVSEGWYNHLGVTLEMVKTHEGNRFCSEECEREFWYELKTPIKM